MNLIYVCVFNRSEFIDLLDLLLESINLFSKINSNTTNILIYTSTEYMNIIKNKHFDNNNILFYINDNYTNVDLACRARLDIFDYDNINKYDNILYLDTDILIQDDIQKIFNIIDDNVLYAVEEGNILDNNIFDYWGKTLFGSDIYLYDDKTAFSSGVLLFKNTIEIKNLFTQIKNHIKERNNSFPPFDQPYIVYNAFKLKLYNNKKLNNNNVIVHFYGGVGVCDHKLIEMNNYLNNLKQLDYCK